MCSLQSSSVFFPGGLSKLNWNMVATIAKWLLQKSCDLQGMFVSCKCEEGIFLETRMGSPELVSCPFCFFSFSGLSIFRGEGDGHSWWQSVQRAGQWGWTFRPGVASTMLAHLSALALFFYLLPLSYNFLCLSVSLSLYLSLSPSPSVCLFPSLSLNLYISIYIYIYAWEPVIWPPFSWFDASSLTTWRPVFCPRLFRTIKIGVWGVAGCFQRVGSFAGIYGCFFRRSGFLAIFEIGWSLRFQNTVFWHVLGSGNLGRPGSGNEKKRPEK